MARKLTKEDKVAEATIQYLKESTGLLDHEAAVVCIENDWDGEWDVTVKWVNSGKEFNFMVVEVEENQYDWELVL